MALLLVNGGLSSHAVADTLPTMHRRPSAVLLSGDESRLYVANRRSGTLSTIDLQTETVTERQIGQQLTALTRRPGTGDMVAVDFAGGELIVVSESNGVSGFTLRKRVETTLWPIAVAVSKSGERCCVASLWSRRAAIHSWSEAGVSAAAMVIDLPFAAGTVAYFDERHAVLGDAFGGRIAVVDCVAGQQVSVRELSVHNIRCLTIDGDDLLLSHQVLNSSARTEAEHIHWGVLMQNELTALPVAALLDPETDLNSVRRSVSVGAAGNGAGDPQAITGLRDHLLVTLGGTDELASIDRVGVREARVAVGSRPVAVTVNRASSRAFVVNELSDSVSIVDLSRNEKVGQIVLGPMPVTGAVERGERAFFSSRLSLENWMSCHSCHTDGHTNNQLADTLGDGSYGDAKRVPSLLGVWATGPWAWNGGHSVLHSQIAASLKSTMHTADYRTGATLFEGRASPDAGVDDEIDAGQSRQQPTFGEIDGDLAADLAAYLTTLSRPPSIASAREDEPSAGEIAQGAAVFESSGCIACHDPFTSLTTDGVFDVGLPDRAGLRRFNPPSLSGVSQRDRLLHDGRAASMSDVLSRFAHPNGQLLSNSERDALIAYLKGL